VIWHHHHQQYGGVLHNDLKHGDVGIKFGVSQSPTFLTVFKISMLLFWPNRSYWRPKYVNGKKEIKFVQ
jgi:hypothetical protein